ncbi:hypothetical protein TNCV_1139821 [Trichonephila clavipes]|nr:hypothetical protein TNCV_1139821 [Trichonephila clavipes]
MTNEIILFDSQFRRPLKSYICLKAPKRFDFEIIEVSPQPREKTVVEYEQDFQPQFKSVGETRTPMAENFILLAETRSKYNSGESPQAYYFKNGASWNSLHSRRFVACQVSSQQLQQDLAGMHPLCKIIGSSDQGMVLSQEERVLGSHVELLRRNTAVFEGLPCVGQKEARGTPNYLRSIHTGPTPGDNLRNNFLRQQEHFRGYPKHSDCKLVRLSGNLTHSTAIHEQHSKGSFSTGEERLFRVFTCYLGLRHHQIWFQLSTYGISLNNNSSIIHNQHYRPSFDTTSTTSRELHTTK